MAKYVTIGEYAVRISERLLIGALLITVALLSLYIAGNYQGFSAGTQEGLLRWMRVVSAFVAASGLVVFFSALIVALTARRLRLVLHAVVAIGIALIGAVLSVASMAVAGLQLPV